MKNLDAFYIIYNFKLGKLAHDMIFSITKHNMSTTKTCQRTREFRILMSYSSYVNFHD